MGDRTGGTPLTVDAVVVGSGPNGLAAAVALAQAGASVHVLEGHTELGGGMRTAELTLPGFHHDVCSACHPMGILSPFFRSLPLDEHGLTWLQPELSVAHPLDDQPAVLFPQGLRETAAGLDREDAEAYVRLVKPMLQNPHELLDDLLGPLGVPAHPLQLARFGLLGMRSAASLARARFHGPRARALFAGCAAHAILPLDTSFTAAVGLVFALTGHVTPWPVAAGGSVAIARALTSLLKSLGGTVETGRWVRTMADVPSARVVLFDTDVRQLADVAGPLLPRPYRERLWAFRHGPGVFKIDWALDGPIPWRDPEVMRASTVHVGGTLAEIAQGEALVGRGQHPDKPFLLLCQQSHLDPSRAPAGQHTGYAYCHVPADSTRDMTDAIESQVERFAPGFRDTILARHTMGCADFERYNPSYVGGAITGGAQDIRQLFTRPVARLDPYSTPHPRLFLCSASTPPGGGVHGMCGFHAAQSALRALDRLPPSPLALPRGARVHIFNDASERRHR